MVPLVAPAHSRPRVEGEREEEILDAAVRLLLDLGYDRLSLDAVALKARASKATLYRRWRGKADLVVDAVARTKRCPEPVDPDTGRLRDDLVAMACCHGGLTDDAPLSVVAGLMSAMHHDAELKRAVHERFIQPRVTAARTVFERAQRRGEIDSGVDIELLIDVLPGMVMNRRLLLGKSVDEDFITHVIDDVVMPAARTSSTAVPTRPSS
ncbi:MAG: TetR/AcrR family transcriptional regulator [Jiangellaceae bacterium]